MCQPAMVTILSPAQLADESLNSRSRYRDMAYGTLGVMAGKVIWGLLADRIGGRLTFSS